MNIIKKVYDYLFKTNTPESVAKSVEYSTGFDLGAIRSDLRTEKAANARRVLVNRLHTYTDLSVADISHYIHRSPQYVYSVITKQEKHND